MVGCGLSGLRAAMLLEARGHQVSLFEAHDRPGGRLHTSPTGFEEGAEWVDEDHNRFRRLMRDLGIGEAKAPPGEYILQFKGSRCMESRPWPQAAADLARFESMANKDSDAETLGEVVYASCLSEEGRLLASAKIRTDEGDEPERIGLSPWQEFRTLYANREGAEGSAYRIEGGGSRFVEAILAKIEAEPRFGTTLLAVREGNGVELVFEGFSVNTDAVIVALPLPCLREIQFDPPLSIANELAKLGFADAVKARFGFATPFWVGEGWNGYMKSDLLIQQTWPDREDPRALIGYIVGDAARTLAGLPSPEMVLSAEWSRWSLTAMPSRTEMKDWSADPFARGAFTVASPGSSPALVRERESLKVQIAGEFCATWMGFMEGALESAEDAVGSLL